jgi:hypothetical protein
MINLNFEPFEVLSVSEDEFYGQPLEFELINGFKLSFTNKDLSNYFERLVEIIGKNNFNRIISESNFNYSENYKSYEGYFGRSLNYIINENNGKKILFLLSFEDQRGHYDIYLEGVWQFEEGEILGELK